MRGFQQTCKFCQPTSLTGLPKPNQRLLPTLTRSAKLLGSIEATKQSVCCQDSFIFVNIDTTDIWKLGLIVAGLKRYNSAVGGPHLHFELTARADGQILRHPHQAI